MVGCFIAAVVVLLFIAMILAWIKLRRAQGINVIIKKIVYNNLCRSYHVSIKWCVSTHVTLW